MNTTFSNCNISESRLSGIAIHNSNNIIITKNTISKNQEYDRWQIYYTLYDILLSSENKTIDEIMDTVLDVAPDGNLTMRDFVNSEFNTMKRTKEEIKKNIEKIKAKH
jgi:parallel beta-helix repeat protein